MELLFRTWRREVRNSPLAIQSALVSSDDQAKAIVGRAPPMVDNRGSSEPLVRVEGYDCASKPAELARLMSTDAKA